MKVQDLELLMVQLGLTKSQAKVYLSLLENQNTTAKTIAYLSKIARQEVYRVLNELYEKGLVDKILTTPTKFKAIPIEDCLNILIEPRKRELSEIKRKVIKLSRNLKIKTEEMVQESTQAALILEKGKYLWRAKKTIVNAQSSIGIITTFERFNAIISIFEEEIKRTLQRGVKLQIIIENANIKRTVPKGVESRKPSTLSPFFIIRYINMPLKNILWIKDNKEVSIITTPEVALKDSTILFTSNKVLVDIIRNYFETLWNSALESKT